MSVSRGAAMPAASSADLHEARAVEAEARAPAPQVRRADEALGDLDEIVRMAAALDDVARDDEAAALRACRSARRRRRR